MSNRLSGVIVLAVLVLAAFAVVRAATARYQQQEDAILQAIRLERQKLDLDRGAAKAKYPTPEISGIGANCLSPGMTGDVVVRGKFVPGTKFVFENDNMEIVKETLIGNEYRATVKVAPGAGPQTAEVVAFSPVTGISARRNSAAIVGGKFEWKIDANNGWKVVARSNGATCDANSSQLTYDMQFFKAGSATPFEKRSAKLYYSAWDNSTSFTIEAAQDPGMTDYMTLMQRMGDPKLSAAERNRIMKQLEQMQTQLQANVSKMADPAYIRQQEDLKKQFGCEHIELHMKGATGTGEMRCSDLVGRRIPVNATLNYLGK